MSDRTSQWIFETLFAELGKTVRARSTSPDVSKFAIALAKKMWKLANQCDFHPGDMEIPKEMTALRLHKPGTEEKDYEDEKWGPQ